MNIADELQKLQDLYHNGSLTALEFAAAKVAVLAGNATETGSESALHAHLEEIKHQNEIARLDREWQIQRERYMIPGRYGQRTIPNRGMSIVAGLVIAGFGVFWTVTAASAGAPSFFPVFGVIFIFFGVAMSLYSFKVAGDYQQAYQSYQRRRSELLSSRDDRTGGQPG